MTPAEHATKAEDLIESASGMIPGTIDHTAAITLAQVHATLATRQPGPELVPAHLLHEAEVEREAARSRENAARIGWDTLLEVLNGYGQDFTALDHEDIIERVAWLMEQVFNSDRSDVGAKPAIVRPLRAAKVQPPTRGGAPVPDWHDEAPF